MRVLHGMAAIANKRCKDAAGLHLEANNQPALLA